MAMWQIVLGSFSGILAGTGLGILGYFLYVRRTGNKRVTLLVVFKVLCGIASKSGGEAASIREPAVGKPVFGSVGVPRALRAVGDPWAAVLATRDAAQEAFAMVANPQQPALVASGVSSASASVPESSESKSTSTARHDEEVLALLSEFNRDIKAVTGSAGEPAAGMDHSAGEVDGAIHGLLSELKKNLESVQASESPAASTIKNEQPAAEKHARKSTPTHAKRRVAKTTANVPPETTLSASAQEPDRSNEQQIPAVQAPVDSQPSVNSADADGADHGELMTQIERMLAVESPEPKDTAVPSTGNEPPAPALPMLEQSPADRGAAAGEPDLAELMAELERNLELVRAASGDTMAALETEVWERNQRLVRGLPTERRETLESVYADVGLLNRLAWMSSQFGRRSPDMVKQYLDLSRRIGNSLEAFCQPQPSDRR